MILKSRLALKVCTILLAFVHIQSSNAIFTQSYCNKITHDTTKCRCGFELEEFAVRCPPELAKFTIRISKINTAQIVRIVCDNMSVSEYQQLLPPLAIGDTPKLQMQYCPLPGHTPISRIFHRLGITQLTGLIFENRDLNSNITRQHLSNLESLQRLHLNLKGLSYMPEDLFADLKNLTWLNLSLNNISLPTNIFASLENLIFLELGYNQLSTLPDGIFRNQRKLNILNLWSNKLHNLTKDNFIGASTVSILDLSENGIETLQPDVFALLTNLTMISLNSNHFRELPEGLFAHNRNLSEFRLMNNRVDMKTVPADLFANLSHLKEVRLISCGLETVPENLFADLRNLNSLDLSGNKLESLPDALFQHAIHLQELVLSDNKLKRISNDIFFQLGNLKVLRVDHNQLEVVEKEAFVGPKDLTELYLESNHLNLSSSSQIILELYGDNEVNSPLQYLHKLEILNLRNNKIRRIFGDWKFVLLELRTLDLSQNNITKFTASDLQFLTRHNLEVDLSYNQISTIQFDGIDFLDEARQNNSMHFNLNDNPLNCNCSLVHFVQFAKGEYAKKFGDNLKVDHSNLVCANPPELRGMKMGELDKEKLVCPREKDCPTDCKCSIRTWDRVYVVNCANGNRTKVPTLARLEDFPRTELNIANNRLHKLPPNIMPGYAEVTHIYAAGNRLTEIDVNTLPLGLVELDVRRNQLHHLNSSVLSFFNRSQTMRSLHLSENQWTCDCLTRPLLQFTQNVAILQKIKSRDFDKMLCTDPNSQIPRKFKDLSVPDICPAQQGLAIALAVIIALIGFLIGITAALYYKYQKEIKIWLYSKNMCLWLVTEEELDKDKKFDAFISYAHEDEKFLTDYLIPELEHGPVRYQLCIHGRDWKAGEPIPDNIMNSIEQSRRTVVVLSQNFLKSGWGRMEFQAAHQAAIMERRCRVIVIIYGDIGDINNLDADLQAYLRMNTYLKWGDPWFWKNLRYALPHPSKKTNDLIKSNMMNLTDDKIELIKPSPVTPPPQSTPPSETTKNPLIAQLNGSTPQTAVIIPNGRIGAPAAAYHMNGKTQNGHINGAFIINPNAKQSDV